MLIIVVTNLCMMSLMSLIVTGYNLKLLWQALKIEEYDWYGYGETYGSEAQLRSDYRYKQVWVWIGWVFGSDKVREGKEHIYRWIWHVLADIQV